LLALVGQLATTGLLTALSVRAAAKDADVLRQQPTYLKGDSRATVPEERLSELVDPTQTIDGTKPVIAEGHTSEGNQKTKARTPIRTPPRKWAPTETDLAKKYSADGHPWRRREISDMEIRLVDKDGFTFNVTCDEGTHHVDIIVTKVDPNTTSPHLLAQFDPPPTEPKASEVLYAKELYPLAYKHFEQVGNPATRVTGEFAWDNYRATKDKYVELLKKNMAADAAAKEAVRASKTYPYHADQGFTQVTQAQDHPELDNPLFDYILDKPE
jgi:hypothetical protein